MLHILKMIVIAAAGVALGLAATFVAVERSQNLGQGAGLWFGAGQLIKCFGTEDRG